MAYSSYKRSGWLDESTSSFPTYSEINGLLLMHELKNALDEGKGKDKGGTNTRLGQTMPYSPGPCSSAAVQHIAEFVHIM